MLEVVLEAQDTFRANVAIRSADNPFPLAIALYSVEETAGNKDAWGVSEFIVFRCRHPLPTLH